MYRFKKLCISVVVASCIGLVACEGTESRKEKYIGVGLEMLEQGNLEKARISFKNVLKIDPKDIKANFYYAKTLEKLEDWPAAAGQYKHVLDLKPDHTEAAIALGKILLLARAPDLALEQAENVIKREAENPDALVLKAGALLIKGETDAGIALVDRVLAAHPGHADASILRSSIYLEKRDLLMAEKVLKTASEADSKNVPVLTLLSRIYAMQAKNAEAETVLKAIISVQPGAENYSKLAEFYFRAKQYAESEKTLTDGIKAFPDSEPLKRTLISVIEAQGDVTRAESALKTFIKSSDEPEVLSVYLAEKLFQWKRESDAEKLLNEIAEQKVSSKAALSAMNMLAVYKQSKGESEQALALIDKVLEKNANDVQALNFRARVSLEKGNYDGAVNDLRSALNQEKNNVQLMKPLVLAYLKRGDIDLAVDQVKTLVSLDANSVDSLALAAQVFEKRKDYDAVSEYLQLALKLQPDNLALLQSMVGVAVQRKQWEVARSNAEHWSELAPDDGKPYYLRGLAEDALGSSEKALLMYEKALEKAPAAVEPATAIVRMYLVNKQQDKALAWVTQALKKNPSAHLLNLKGEVLLGKNDEAGAIKSFEDSLKMQPDWWIPYRSIAMIYSQKNNFTQAEQWFKKGIENVKNNALLRAEFASLLEKNGKVEDATEQYRAIVNASSTAPEAAVNNLAMLLVTYQSSPAKIQEALALVKRLENSKNPWYLDTVGWVYLKAGDQEKAYRFIKRAADELADQPVIRYHLGAVYHAQNDKERARQELAGSLESGKKFPGINEAKMLLQEIESNKQAQAG